MRMVPAHSGGFGFLKATVKASLTSLPDPAPGFETDCQANRLGSVQKTLVMMIVCRSWFAGLAVSFQLYHNLQTIIISCVLPADPSLLAWQPVFPQPLRAPWI